MSDTGGSPGPEGLAGEGVPEVAGERLRSGSFSSGLTVPDFAACLQMGLQPVGLVQGFCVMQQSWYGPPGSMWGSPGGYSSNWPCPHGFVSAEHRVYGQNYEQPWVEDAWAQGFGAAYERMIDEAKELGAHGVIGVTDYRSQLTDTGAVEFHIYGTAVRVEGASPATGWPWATYLAGQRLAKLIEAGLMPVSIAAAMVSIRVWASCITQYQMEGSSIMGWGAMGAQEVEQVTEAHTVVRRLARERVRQQLGGDSLHAAIMEVGLRTVGEGDEALNCVLRGTRVRRIRHAAPLPAPRPTVRLS
jgi:hypothetical protein